MAVDLLDAKVRERLTELTGHWSSISWNDESSLEQECLKLLVKHGHAEERCTFEVRVDEPSSDKRTGTIRRFGPLNASNSIPGLTELHDQIFAGTPLSWRGAGGNSKCLPKTVIFGMHEIRLTAWGERIQDMVNRIEPSDLADFLAAHANAERKCGVETWSEVGEAKAESVAETSLEEYATSRIEWDARSRTLTFEGHKFPPLASQAKAQISVLNAFDHAGWAESVESPFDSLERQKRKDAVKRLNERFTPLSFQNSENHISLLIKD